ncbi:MAG: T9SS type A sorting domain-containing protein [Bacteroidota bacterium]
MKKLFFLLLTFCSLTTYGQPPKIGPKIKNAATLRAPNKDIAGAANLAIGGGTAITPTTHPAVAAQWHFAGYQNIQLSSSEISHDWIYGLVNTDKKETIACGFGYGSNVSTTLRITGTIFKLDHVGNLQWHKTVSCGTCNANSYDFSSSSTATPTTTSLNVVGSSSLWAIAKASDGYVAVGKAFGNKLLVVIVDENGNFIKKTPMLIIPPATPTNTDGLSSTPSTLTSPFMQGFSVAINPLTNSVNNIIVGGCVQGGGFEGAGVVEYNFDPMSGSSGDWTSGHSWYGGAGGSVVNKLLVKATSGSTFDIYGCGALSSTETSSTIPTINDRYTHPTIDNLDDEDVTLTTYNKDIWVFNLNNTFATYKHDVYNKSNIIVNVTGGTSDITTYGTSTYPYQEFGPLTARNHVSNNALEFMQMAGTFPFFSYAGNATIPLGAPNNYNEIGVDMILTNDDKLAVIGLVNVIGSNKKSGIGYTTGGLIYSHGAAHPNYGEYQDGDGFLLKIEPEDLGTTTSTTQAKNVGHFSGKDFFMQIQQDPEDHYIIAGSTADKYGTSAGFTYTPSADVNFRDAELGYNNAFIVATDDNFAAGAVDIWRRSYLAVDDRATEVGPGTGGMDNMNEGSNCVFGFDMTADGGFIIGGDNRNNGDDYTVTKFGPMHQSLMVYGTGGSYSTFGGSAIPAIYTVGSSETWNTSRNIATKVVVPSGSTLTISGSTTTISFAASDQLWDYADGPTPWTAGTLGCGIVVEPGGTLNISDATLRGISIPGQHNVWDGIVVQGVYTASPTSSQHGRANITDATITDARVGLFIAENYRAYNKASGSTGATYGFTYSSQYDGTFNKGGGIVTVDNTSFLNCRYGANFENYIFGTNGSTFTNCTFNSDAAGMGDICYYTDATGALLPAHTHISAWQWSGIDMKDNIFTCSTTFPNAMRPVGVSGVATGLSITSFSSPGGNLFTNLSNGIVVSWPGCVAYPVTITDNTFDNNFFGLKASGMLNSLIVKNNQFKVPFYGGFTMTSGIVLAGCHGYDVSYNTFDRSTYTSPYNGPVGIIVNNGHSENETIHNNTFNHINMGNVATQTNGVSGGSTGLQYRCNIFNQNGGIYRSSIIFGTGTVAGTMRQNQGFCAGLSTPAGNQFNLPCATGVNRLTGDASVTQVIDYYNNHTGGIYDPNPCYSSSLYSNHTCAPSGADPLASVACPLGYNYSAGGRVIARGDLSTLDGVMLQTTDPAVYAELQAVHDDIVAFLVRSYAAQGYYDSAAALLASYNMYRDAFAYYLLAGDGLNAVAMQSNLPTQNDEESLYAWQAGLTMNLLGNGQTWFDLDSTSQDSLLHVAQYNRASGYMAGAVNALIGAEEVAWPMPDIDSNLLDSVITDTSANKMALPGHNDASPITEINENAHFFAAYPNPSAGIITIKSSAAGKLTLLTMLGQKVAEYEISGMDTELRLPSQLAPGVYMCQFKSAAGDKVKELKLIYQP